MPSGSHNRGAPPDQPVVLDSFSVVGSGALARTLSRSLVNVGIYCDLVTSRSADHANTLANDIGASHATTYADADFSSARLVLMAVPDDALSSLASDLAQRSDWKNTVVLHTSGALDASVLEPLEQAGARTGSFHPLQTFTGNDSPDVFKGVSIGIEGSEQACLVATHIADSLLSNPVEIPSAQKALYHAAAVMASNHAVTLMAAAEEFWQLATENRQSFSEALGPLIKQSVSNAVETGPEEALTGPIVRGDAGTLQLHLEAVSRFLPHLLPLYGAVAAETVHLSMRSGRLSPEQAVHLLDAIEVCLQVDSNSEEPGE